MTASGAVLFAGHPYIIWGGFIAGVLICLIGLVWGAVGALAKWCPKKTQVLSPAAIMAAVARGYRQHHIDGRLKWAKLRYEKKQYEYMLDILDQERVAVPVLMSANTNGLSLKQIEALSGYQAKERELQIYIDGALRSRGQTSRTPDQVAHGFLHKMKQVAQALDDLIDCLERPHI